MITVIATGFDQESKKEGPIQEEMEIKPLAMDDFDIPAFLRRR